MYCDGIKTCEPLCLQNQVSHGFCVKYRKRLLNNDITTFLKNTCSEIGEKYSFEFDAIGCDGDHGHLFVGAEPKHSPSRVSRL